MKYPSVQSRTVLFTGCSTGIGWAGARYLREHGWSVLPTARKPEDLERLERDGFAPVALDLSDPASVQAAVRETLERCEGRLGGVVNNAGYGQAGAVEDIPREDLRHQFEVNVFGMQELTNELIPVFRNQGWGRIVNVSSVLGRISLPFMGVYSASKFAMEALSDALRVELYDSGIAVVLIEPGPIESNFRSTSAEWARHMLEHARSPYRGRYERELERRGTLQGEGDAMFMRSPEAVARKIRKALESPRPRIRYPVTVPAYFGAFMRRYSPDALNDRILRHRWKRKRSG